MVKQLNLWRWGLTAALLTVLTFAAALAFRFNSEDDALADGSVRRLPDSTAPHGDPDPARKADANRVLCDRAQCPSCPLGTSAQTKPDVCCPVCISHDDRACDEGLAHYESLRTRLDAELRSCKEDGDCIVVSHSDTCSKTCPSPVNKLKIGSIVPLLREQSAKLCEACPRPELNCKARLSDAVACVEGLCEFQ